MIRGCEKVMIVIPPPVTTSVSAEDIPLEIVYEDSDLLVVDKPSGMVVHPASGHRTGTLVNAVLAHDPQMAGIGGEKRPGIVHRLDKDTSGLIIIAKDNFTHMHLSDQFKNHSISRKYRAIVWGIPKNQMIEGYIERNKINRKKMTLNQSKGGKFSQTIITLRKNFGVCSIVECLLKTGRTHQVRLHMTSINNPIVGDKLYGKNKINRFGKDKENFNKFLILKNFRRQALHAYHIGFTHPLTKKYLEFESGFPEDLKNLLDLLVKY